MRKSQAGGVLRYPVPFKDAAKMLGVTLVELKQMEQRLDIFTTTVHQKKVVMPSEILRAQARQ